MGLKKNRWIFFKRLRMQTAWRWKFLGSAFKWKRLNLQLSFVDDVLFRILSVFEAIVLVATLCFFYLCCGCHFWRVSHYVIRSPFSGALTVPASLFSLFFSICSLSFFFFKTFWLLKMVKRKQFCFRWWWAREDGLLGLWRCWTCC